MCIRDSILDAFEAHFQEGISEGRSEEEIMNDLGTIDDVLENIHMMGGEKETVHKDVYKRQVERSWENESKTYDDEHFQREGEKLIENTIYFIEVSKTIPYRNLFRYSLCGWINYLYNHRP